MAIHPCRDVVKIIRPLQRIDTWNNPNQVCVDLEKESTVLPGVSAIHEETMIHTSYCVASLAVLGAARITRDVPDDTVVSDTSSFVNATKSNVTRKKA